MCGCSEYGAILVLEKHDDKADCGWRIGFPERFPGNLLSPADSSICTWTDLICQFTMETHPM